MCKFKSGILLKDKVILAPGGNESHSDLLVSLDIKDDYLGASKTFVRAELIPKQNQWWVSPREYPEQWEFVVDQDITPEWFDREEREKAFREAVCEWWESHVIIGQKMDRLNHGYYRLKECEIEELSGDAEVFLVDSRVGEMQGSSRVGEMRGNSCVGEMWGSSRIGEMQESSCVGEMRGNSYVGEMWGSSRVGKMRGNSCVGEMWGSSCVGEMCGSSRIGEMQESSCVGKMWGSSRVGEMWGSSRVGEMWGSSRVGEMCGSSRVGKMWGSSCVGEMWGSSRIGRMCGSSRVGEMRGNSSVGKMWGSSSVGKMWENSRVGEMWETATAIDYRDYPQITIHVADTSRFILKAHKEETDEGRQEQ